MKHKPFEAWILTDEPLATPEKGSLREHLRECDVCYELDNSWRQVERFLTSVSPLTAPPGFAVRWQAHLEARRQIRERRQSLALLIVSTGGAGIVFVLFFAQFLPQIRSLPQVVWGSLGRVYSWLLFLDTAQDILLSLARTLPGAVPLPLWMGVFALIGAGGILWLKTFRKLAYYQGFPQWA